MGDNPFADARELSSRTDAQTILLTIACGMTFYFFFEVILKLKPIQTNIKGGGLQIENNQGGGTKTRTISSRIWLFWKLVYGLISTGLQKKIFRCPDHPYALTSHGLNCIQV